MNGLHWFQPSPVVLCMQNSDFRTRITSLCGSKTPPVVFGCKTAPCGPEEHVTMSPRHNLSFLHANQHDLHQNDKSVWVPALICFFSMQNSDFMTRLTSLHGSQTSSVVLTTHNSVLGTRIKRPYGFQPSPVVLCMQNCDFSTWITSLYWSQPSSEVFACEPATFGAELQVYIGPRHDLSFCVCITAWLASKIQVSMGPSPHVWFLDA